MKVNVNGVWRDIHSMKVLLNGVYRDVSKMEIHNGVWRAHHKPNINV